MDELLKKIKKSNLVIIAVLFAVYLFNVLFIGATNITAIDKRNREGNKFTGSFTCIECHKSIYESHTKTAHYLDSRPAKKEFIKGNFESGKNKFIYNKFMEVVLEQKENTFFQTAYINGSVTESQQFDIVIGSARKGQTYLYWNDHELFQLPVSYYTPLNSWCNSPGYSNKYINFNRIITPQCLECHTTYAAFDTNETNHLIYDKNQIIYGIDCERCHGPAADHVAYHQTNAGEKIGRYIISTKLMNRLQKLDACALCHTGFRKDIQPAFTFAVGDKLADFSTPMYSADSLDKLDVHGNQYGLLTASKCFKMSEMDCSTCHNVHVNEVKESELFSQKCIACHSQTSHASLNLPANKEVMLNNCIECHMPLLPSAKIVLDVANENKAIPDLVRTHRVGIYRSQTTAILKGLK